MLFSEKQESNKNEELNIYHDKKRTYSAFYRTETEESSSVGNENSIGKEDEENKLRNEKRQQRFKKYQLETQANVNDALKTLDFSENESFRKGMGNIIDEYALAKSAQEFETDPAKSKELGNKIFKMDSFFKKSF